MIVVLKGWTRGSIPPNHPVSNSYQKVKRKLSYAISQVHEEMVIMNPDKRPAWTLKISNMEDPDVTTITVWIRQPPRGLVSDIEELLKKYIGE